jgi:hypothetical protein
VPEELEVPTEHLHEHIKEELEKKEERWIFLVAMSTALLAVIASVGSLLAGHHANESLLDQIQSSDQWSYYQAKGVKSAVLEGKMDMLEALGKERSEADAKKVEEYKAQQKEIEAIAREKAESADRHLAIHSTFAKCVTLMQVAIAIAAISVITRKKWLWSGSLALGIVGIVFFVLGLF